MRSRLLEKLFSEKVRMPDGFTITAHTGCLDTPDNSVEAIEAGVEAGAQIVEFDLSFTAEGAPVLSHDAPQDKCVPLEDAFACLARHDGIYANIDVKDTSGIECIPPLAEQYGLAERIFLTGIEEADVPTVREKCPGVPYYLNTTIRPFAHVHALAQKVKSLGAIGVNISKRHVSSRLIRVFHAQGLLVSVWTVNGRCRARYVLSLQPDNVTTRRPDRIGKMIR